MRTKRTCSSQSGFGHLEPMLVVLIVVVFGFVGWRVYEAKKPVPRLSISQIIEKYEKERGDFPELSLKDYREKQDSILTPYVAYEATTPKILSAAKSDNWLHLTGKADVIQSMLDVQAKNIAALLTANGFEYVAHPPINITEPAHIQNPPYGHAANGYYLSEDTICLMGSSAALAIDGTSSLYVDCVSKDAINKAAQKVVDFDAAYKDYIDKADVKSDDQTGERGGYPISAYLYEPQVKSSGTGDYHYATVSIRATDYSSSFSAVAFFYTNSGGKNWKFAGASQQGLFCKNLPDTDAKTALASICLADDAQL